MFKEYSKDNFKIIFTLIDGSTPCINIYFDVFGYNYTLYGPKKNFEHWVNMFTGIFESASYTIEYANTFVRLRYNDQTQLIDRVEYPMNYILQSMGRIDKLEQLVKQLIA